MTALAISPSAATPRRIASDILGPLEATEDGLLTFPRGVLGFPECRQFLLLASAHDGIYWLQSTEFSALTFVLADPFQWGSAKSCRRSRPATWPSSRS